MRITCPQCEHLSREEQERCKHIKIDPAKIPAQKLLYNIAPAITKFDRERKQYNNRSKARRCGV